MRLNRIQETTLYYNNVIYKAQFSLYFGVISIIVGVKKIIFIIVNIRQKLQKRKNYN